MYYYGDVLLCLLGCGGVQSGVAGVLYSPNYPGNYIAGSHCAWHLEAPEGQIITVSIS